MTSLFIGNLSPNLDKRELEKAFSLYGKVKINLKGKFGFAEYEKEEEAEEAKEKLQDRKFGGERINIEWSQKSGKFTKRERRPQRPRRSKSREKAKRSKSRSPLPKYKNMSKSKGRSKSKSQNRKRKEGSEK